MNFYIASFASIVFFFLVFTGELHAADDDLSKALEVCQKDPEPKARVACYEAVKSVQALRENPFLRAMNKKASGSKPDGEKQDERRSKETVDEKFARSAVTATLTNKEFRKSDFSAGRYKDFLELRMEIEASSLKKKTRAIKGVMVFSDLFGEEKYRIRWTLNEPLSPGQVKIITGQGIEPNQFSSADNWLLNTDVKDISTAYVVEKIIYADGATWDHGK